MIHFCFKNMPSLIKIQVMGVMHLLEMPFSLSLSLDCRLSYNEEPYVALFISMTRMMKLEKTNHTLIVHLPPMTHQPWPNRVRPSFS